MFNRFRARKESSLFTGFFGGLSGYFLAFFVSFPEYLQYIQLHKNTISLNDCIINQFNQLESAERDLLEQQARTYAKNNAVIAGYILIGFLLGCVLGCFLPQKKISNIAEPEEKRESNLTLQERLDATGWKEIPDSLKDPVSFELLDNPFLIVESGHSFNPGTIANLQHNRCPMTQMPFYMQPVPNHTLKKAAEDYVLEKEAWSKEQKQKNTRTIRRLF